MTTTNTLPALPPEVTPEGLGLLKFSRSRACRDVAEEVASVLALLADPETNSEAANDTPEWMRAAFAEGVTSAGAFDWSIGRAHIARRTAEVLHTSIVRGPFSAALAEAFRQLDILQPEEPGKLPAVAPSDLAAALSIDLYEFAAEAWAGCGEQPTEESA